MRKIVNFDYLNLWKEIPLFLLMGIMLRKEKRNINNGRILIVEPCLMGEFVASIPAIYDFAQRHNNKKIDLMVSLPLKILAERIKGINEIHVAQSVYNREVEQVSNIKQSFPDYEEVIILRTSGDVFKALKKIHAFKIQSGAYQFIKYALHLQLSLFLRKTPKQWSVLNFEMLSGVPRNILSEEIFEFNESEIKNIKRLIDYNAENQKILIHTGSSWKMMHWENKKWINLLEKINQIGKYDFIFVGTKRDNEDFEYISSHLTFKLHSVVDQINTLELLLLMRNADYFIGIDSGPSNIARLANLRNLVILGPGPHLFMPTNKKDIVIDKSRGRGFYQRFFAKKKGYIQKIGVEEVFAAFLKLSLK